MGTKWKQEKQSQTKKRRRKEERRDNKGATQIALEKALTTSSTASEGRPELKIITTELPENNNRESSSSCSFSLGDAFPAL